MAVCASRPGRAVRRVGKAGRPRRVVVRCDAAPGSAPYGGRGGAGPPHALGVGVGVGVSPGVQPPVPPLAHTAAAAAPVPGVPPPVPVKPSLPALPGVCGAPTRGAATPLGATRLEAGAAGPAGVNFAVYSSVATGMSLLLFAPGDLAGGVPTHVLDLDPQVHRTGATWHVFLPDLADDLLYAYHVVGPNEPEQGIRCKSDAVLLDPYAQAVVSRGVYGVPAVGKDGGDDCWPPVAAGVPAKADDFDWEGDTRPQHDLEDLVIYEMHVRGFTRHESSGVTSTPGTFAALKEKLPYLKTMGFNAIELLPCQEFNELEYYSVNPTTNEMRYNFWGYSTLGFFAPMARYAAAGAEDCGRAAVREFKEMVKACHSQGIEVIMDVVFNHTAEGNELGPTLSFRGFDNRVYYMTAPRGQFYNYSGCGNTFNCNHPVVKQFIVDCLRYWVLECHVDGFRFDLASILTRASSTWEEGHMYNGMPAPEAANLEELHTGTPLECPPVVDAISNDSVLRDVKLIAEAWDAGGLYQVGSFPHWGIWAEWNGKFRDTVRQFMRGMDGYVGLFAECVCGSPNLYKEGGRKPRHSINFITAHDGFTLADLTSYNNKNNLANGENDQDGENENLSWNCGNPDDEGDNASLGVLALRKRQQRNFIVALMVAQGVPMVHMGDEYGHSKGGNNNTYCHDNELNWFRWDVAEKDPNGLSRFFRGMRAFRASQPAMRLRDWPTGENIQWHGLYPDEPDWSDESRFIGFTLHEATTTVYCAFNSSHEARMVKLPNPPDRQLWALVADTGLPAPYDFVGGVVKAMPPGTAEYLSAGVYPLLDRASVVLRSVPDPNAPPPPPPPPPPAAAAAVPTAADPTAPPPAPMTPDPTAPPAPAPATPPPPPPPPAA